jgi:hypothetical protein
MLEGAPWQIGRNTRVERSVTLAGHNVHAGLFHRHFSNNLSTVIASEAKQSILAIAEIWIASSLRSSQ